MRTECQYCSVVFLDFFSEKSKEDKVFSFFYRDVFCRTSPSMDSYGRSYAAKAGPAIFRSGYTNTNITLDVIPVVVEGRDAGCDTTKVDEHEPISNISKKDDQKDLKFSNNY